MPAIKSDIYITIRAGGKSFSIGGVLLQDGHYAIKRGRSWSRKVPLATLTDIFTQARKWAVKNA
ncbi:MAG: hypothetical protein A2143_02380 [Gallionellales bacterium RBG_16_57_15]|nr:MAG: hypothetical protein A2143_02380 [Gallionellales bacterium RBG_16_57_15]